MTATGTAFSPITETGIQMFNENALEQDDGNYFWNGAGRELLEIDESTNLNVTLDQGSYVDSTTHYITIHHLSSNYFNYTIFTINYVFFITLLVAH